MATSQERDETSVAADQEEQEEDLPSDVELEEDADHLGNEIEDPYNSIPAMGMIDVPLTDAAETATLLDTDKKSLGRSSNGHIYTDLRGWDVFQVLEPEEDNHGNEKLVKLAIQFTKIITYIFVFLLVLASAVVAKGCVLFMAGNITPGKIVPLCGETDTKTGVIITRSVVIPETVAVSWVWALYLAYCVPEFFSFLYSLRKTMFRSLPSPPCSMIAIVVVMEMIHTVGFGILLFSVLPNLDAVRGAMITNCLCFVPALLQLLSRHRGEGKRYRRMLLDTFAVIAQVTGLVVWPLVRPDSYAWSIPVALLMTSVVWWENFLDKQSPFPLIPTIAAMSERLYKTRYKIYIFLSPVKCIVMLGTMIGLTSMNIRVQTLLDPVNIFTPRNMSVVTTRTPIRTADQISDISAGLDIFDFRHSPVSDNELWLVQGKYAVYVLLIQCFSALICYNAGKFACRIVIQKFSFALPINFTVPVLFAGLIALIEFRLKDNCYAANILPGHLFFNLYGSGGLGELFTVEHSWIWILWLISQFWVTYHIWNPKCERLAKAEKLFVLPMYHGLIIDQDLALNRRRDDEAEVLTEDMQNSANATAEDPSPHYETLSIADSQKDKYYNTKTPDTVTKIIACATMWHETRDEMKQILKSITRMDADQAARRNAQEHLHVVDPDYYEYQTHIYFDDAFEVSDESDDDNVVNHFVKLFCGVIDEAVSAVHQTQVSLKPPQLTDTPYGGRLIWTFPGKTKMYVHLKDKGKIRHRKRWSQVMYMYYLLGFNLMDLPIEASRKDAIAENTYLLTLDGDIDFKPHAVQLLVDLMKKNKGLGATCGRIHPVGSGVMVWYQRFEYAIGHWLQKATEHMIGCVMCCPGCFSLFRAKTLMDDNVMRRYAVKAEEALHYVQFDQGEDRWLCTLILQRGYRVEYCAASDAWTHAPEGFNEFFNQRRRWVPSTLANILDLLLDANNVVKVNDNISWGYIVYQICLMIGTILGPGTIFMMIIGACVAAFRVDNWTAFYSNIIPIIFYMVVCLACQAKWQLLLAQIMSTLYALLMMAVIVGTAIQISDDGWGSPSSIFLITIVGTFCCAAILHPQEFFCIGHGFLYFLSIPAMYLLLMIYSLCNLNVVSWGTRETATKKSQAELAKEKAEAQKVRTVQKREGILGMFQRSGNEPEEDGGLAFNCGNLFKCMMFTHEKPNPEKDELLRIEENLTDLTKKVDALTNYLNPIQQQNPEWAMMANNYHNVIRPDMMEPPTRETSPRQLFQQLQQMPNTQQDTYDDGSAASHIYGSVHEKEEDDSPVKYWMKDKVFQDHSGEVGIERVIELDEKETEFWKDLIKKYLYPLDEDKAQQARIAADLKELRNKSVFMYFMFNALFVLIVFLLQLNKYHLHVDWPLGVKVNVTIVNGQPVVTKEYLQLEPIGIVFVMFFFSILVIQFFAMLFHRFGTISHILAACEIDWLEGCCRGSPKRGSEEENAAKNAVEFARNIQSLAGINDPTDTYRAEEDRPGFRKIIPHLEKQRRKKQKVGTLDVAFRKRFQEFTKAVEAGDESQVRKRYPVRTIDPETDKAVRHLVQEKKKLESVGKARSAAVVGFSDNVRGVTPTLDMKKAKDMFDSAENLHVRGALRSRKKLEDIFNNFTKDQAKEDGYPNEGFDPYDLGDNTVSGDFDNNHDMFLDGHSPNRSRRSPSVHTLDEPAAHR